MVFKHLTNRLVCTSCGLSRVHQNVADGTNVDNNDFHNLNQNVDSRLKAYRKFIEQFSEDVQMPSADTLNAIVAKLIVLNPHLVKIKPVHISEIVTEIGHSELKPLSLRITWLIERGRVITISSATIQTLLARFREMQDVFIMQRFKGRIKIINFEYLTRQFLFMEHMPDIARQFEGLRTTRLFNEDRRLRDICEHINRKPGGGGGGGGGGPQWFVTSSV